MLLTRICLIMYFVIQQILFLVGFVHGPIVPQPVINERIGSAQQSCMETWNIHYVLTQGSVPLEHKFFKGLVIHLLTGSRSQCREWCGGFSMCGQAVFLVNMVDYTPCHKTISVMLAGHLCGGRHANERDTSLRVREFRYWFNMKVDIERFVENCDVCMDPSFTPSHSPYETFFFCDWF